MTALPPSIPTQAFIDGELVDAATGATLDTFEPGAGTVLAAVADCGVADVERATAAARAAFEKGSWRKLAPASRKTVLLRFADLVEAHASELAFLDAVNAGKPISDCEQIDLPDVVATLRWYAESLDKLFDKVSPTGPENLALIVREPIGVVAAVLPWNFPTATLAWKIGPALAAGNSIVVKPPEQAPLSTIRMAQLAAEAGLPDGVFNVVPGRGEVAGRALGLSHDVDAVTFTGSTEVGRHFLRYAADSNLKRIVLECGGKSPQIVMADAARRPRLRRRTARQRGLLEHRPELHRRFAHPGRTFHPRRGASRPWRRPPPASRSATRSTTTPGWARSSSPRRWQRILRYIDEAGGAGATVAFGGRRILEETGGWFVQPTILDDVTPDMAVAREEIFGPVVSMITFADEDEAIALANDTDYGLAASVFTHDLDRAHRMARAVRAGTVSVNCYSEGDITTPFGGYKTSGFGGRDKGIEALDQYSELKTIWFALR